MNNTASPDQPRFFSSAPRLLDQVREVMRYYHYGYKTEQSYISWIKRFIRFNDMRHPQEMGKAEIERFLSHLALNRNVAVSTQRQALNAIVYLYKQVLDSPVAKDLAPVKAKKQVRLPVVMSRSEAGDLLRNMAGVHGLMARLMYGGGLRLMECVRLRVQDIDFANVYVSIHDGKGNKDRSTLLPPSLVAPLKQHLQKVAQVFKQDLEQGHANVYLPNALDRKYLHAARSWGWQYVFPSKTLSTDPKTGEVRRHHVGESGLQKAVKSAKAKAGIAKRVTTHTLRHSFATHLLESGTNIRVVQKLMGHRDVKTTEIYTHVLQRNLDAVTSPLELLD